ncbi:MAG: hypothetical protein LBT50_06305 [Prevotellaceae bacterium]|jgi:hypothetical protein|nr:hypothetical protein [Prevotellaceae bacterium]
MFDDDDDFDFDDFDNYEYRKRMNEFENSPIYLKGQEIKDVVFEICSLIPDNDDDEIQSLKGEILFDASQLTRKLAFAHNAFYDLKMEAAAIIRKAARDLMVMDHSLVDIGFKDVRYFKIVRRLIEEYRLLFIDWVAGFDQWNYITDRWGLFNPPGISPFDPDDSIPFNRDDDDDD